MTDAGWRSRAGHRARPSRGPRLPRAATRSSRGPAALGRLGAITGGTPVSSGPACPGLRY
jgi:hypothetical protein